MRLVLILSLFLLSPSLALAKKVALVIGNSAYESVVPLDNPGNDARDVSAALTRQGFQVISALDQNRAEMRHTLRDFRDRADSAEVALVYYAGHGIEIAGRNYLVPVDARLEDHRDAELEMIDLDLVLAQISGANALKMVVLDACRNNPFVAKMKRQGASRSINSGLGRIEYAEADTLIAYAAAAGEITPDGRSGGNSPFTAAFLSALEEPPMDVRRLLGQVRDKMRAVVPGAAPFVYTSLGGGEFVINPNSSRSTPSESVAVLPNAVPAPTNSAISEDFVRIDRDGTFEDWNAFLIRHARQSDHPLYAFALEKREALRGTAPGRTAREEAGLSAPVVAPPAVVETQDDDAAARELQVLLREAGCYRGAIDGILGRGSAAGLRRFEQAANVRFPQGARGGGTPLRQAIEIVSDRPEVKCIVAAATPKRAQPQPRPRVQTAPAPVVVAPAPRQTPTKAPGSREPDRTKLLPEKGSEQIECTGSRRKFYDCD
ncbi:MAG: caspase family protein [Arenibacterium sp.]